MGIPVEDLNRVSLRFYQAPVKESVSMHNEHSEY